MTYSQALYKQLIDPIKKYLPAKGKLVFILENEFQNFPIGMLYDGQKYLIETYDISIALSSNLESKAFNPEQLNLIFAGISQSNPNLDNGLEFQGLAPLPEVETEATLIKSEVADIKILLNQKFTAQRLNKLIESSKFPIVHISTHGQFSSDVDKTFVLAWDEPINVKEFEALIRSSRDPIELLVLSACQTAKGDKRSALGIAGVAVMAGARSTLATLWLVDAESTAQLMGDFYKGLKNGLDESQALRQAQLTLAKDPRYSHPYYWAPFILLGR